MFKNYFLLLAIFLLGHSFAYSQNSILDTLIGKMNAYGASKSQTSLFIHYDKNIYTNHEFVWFTGYLLNHDEELSDYHTLSIALVRNENRQILLENKFVIKNGISSGCIFLPDSLTAGNYHLVAFTNRIANNLPEDVFLQPITIKNVFSEFSTSLTLLDSTNQISDTVKVLLKARTPDLLPLEGAHVNYIVGTGTDMGKESKLVLNKSGEAIISINRSSIPEKNNLIYIKVDSKGIIKDLSLTLPIKKKDPTIRFYPEGGNLINETLCNIGWEVKTGEGSPVSISGLLYEDNQIIDTINTSAYGMGKFKLIPKIGKIYTVKVNSEYIKGNFSLPAIQETTPGLSIENAVVVDTLIVKLQNSSATNKLYLVIHRFNQLFQAFEVNKSNSSQELKIPLSKLPKGISEITLIDNLQRPLAERLFFAHYDREPDLGIEPNKEEYNKKEQVEIALKLDSIKNKTKNALVSIACVQSNRIDIRNVNDIESFTYLTQVIEDIPFKHLPLKSSIEANNYLEDILLIKGWRRYNWKDLLEVKASDYLVGKKSLEINGVLLKNGFIYTKSAQINVLADSSLGIITTNSKGFFKMNPEDIIVRSQKSIKLFMNKDNDLQYSYKLNDQFKLLHKQLASKLEFINHEETTMNFNSGDLLLKKDETANQLQEVIVKSKLKNDKDYLGSFLSDSNVNECGDYVCKNEVLNCPEHKNHILNKPAIKGQMYYTSNGFDAILKLMVYNGCLNKKASHVSVPETPFLNGIFLNKEFYQTDNVSPLIAEPEYVSTLYWNPQVIMNTETLFKISFKTGVIAGKFKIIVQGRTDDDVIYQENFITVK